MESGSLFSVTKRYADDDDYLPPPKKAKLYNLKTEEPSSFRTHTFFAPRWFYDMAQKKKRHSCVVAIQIYNQYYLPPFFRFEPLTNQPQV